MKKRSLDDLTPAEIDRHVRDKVVLLRADYNVRDEQDQIVSRTRLERSIPTLQWLTERQARVVILSHRRLSSRGCRQAHACQYRGGAMLTALAGEPLPGVDIVDDVQ